MTDLQKLALLAASGSALLLAVAMGFQHLGGLEPCTLCIWQRWPHAAAIALGIIVFVLRRREPAWLASAVLITGAAIAAYHVGVEQSLWQGPSSCSGGGGLESLTGAQLLEMTGPTGVVACDEIVWQFAGLSMAAWNGLLTLALALVWLFAAQRAVAR